MTVFAARGGGGKRIRIEPDPQRQESLSIDDVQIRSPANRYGVGKRESEERKARVRVSCRGGKRIPSS